MLHLRKNYLEKQQRLPLNEKIKNAGGNNGVFLRVMEITAYDYFRTLSKKIGGLDGEMILDAYFAFFSDFDRQFQYYLCLTQMVNMADSYADEKDRKAMLYYLFIDTIGELHEKLRGEK